MCVIPIPVSVRADSVENVRSNFESPIGEGGAPSTLLRKDTCNSKQTSDTDMSSGLFSALPHTCASHTTHTSVSLSSPISNLSLPPSFSPPTSKERKLSTSCSTSASKVPKKVCGINEHGQECAHDGVCHWVTCTCGTAAYFECQACGDLLDQDGMCSCIPPDKSPEMKCSTSLASSLSPRESSSTNSISSCPSLASPTPAPWWSRDTSLLQMPQIEHMSDDEAPHVWHLFSGPSHVHSVSSAATRLGAVAVDIDILIHPSMDLGNREYVDSIILDMAKVRRPRVSIDVKCNLFSVARFKPGGARVLRRRSTNGAIHDLSDKERTDLTESDAFVDAAVRVATAASASGGSFIIENAADRGGCDLNPLFDLMWADHFPLWMDPRITQLVTDTGAIYATFPQCALGGEFQKWTTVLMSPDLSPLASYLNSLGCSHTDHARVARGFDANGASEGAAAAVYPPRMCLMWAQALTRPEAMWQESDLLRCWEMGSPEKLRILESLKTWKEGPALQRAETERPRSKVGDFSMQRLMPERNEVIRLLPLASVELEDATVKSRPHWFQRRFEEGINWDWRPKGCADTLFTVRSDWFDMKHWLSQAVTALEAKIEGVPCTPPADKIISILRLEPEARALAPWATWGKYEQAPVPIAVLIMAGELSGEDAADQGICKRFYEEMRKVDPDTDIIDEYLNGGLEDESTAEDIYLSFHHNTCDDFMDEFTEMMDLDVELGYLRSFEGGVPCVPFRTPPKGMLEQGRKRRMITDHAYPNRSVRSNNGKVDLADQPDLKLSSGLEFGRDVAILASAGVPVRVYKRDGLRAYRQARTLALDWLRNGTIWKGGAYIDVRVNFGGKASPGKFSRWYKIPVREAMRRIRKFDAEHPPTDPKLLAWLRERGVALGDEQAVMGILIQYIDDTLGASFDDAIEGSSLTRAQHHMKIFDDTFDEAGILLAQGRKKEDSLVGMEALGVYIDLVFMTAYLTRERKEALSNQTSLTLSNCIETGQVKRKDVESLVGKQKWLAHVAPELNKLLSSSYAIIHAPGKSPFVKASERFKSDQEKIVASIPHLTDVPLVPRSAFAPYHHPTHTIAFQDASECYGMGGWFPSDTHLYYFVEPWPTELGTALRARPREWFITHSELLAEAFAIDMVARFKPDTTHLTDFTDNEAARGAANRGSSTSEGMHTAAVWIDEATTAANITTRTMRVTTHENWVADQLSRGILDAGERAARLLGLIPCRVSYSPDHPIWELARLSCE